MKASHISGCYIPKDKKTYFFYNSEKLNAEKVGKIIGN
jgi:hypothetical protein